MPGKQTQFARAFEPWIDRWAEMGLSARQLEVLLKLITYMERNSRGEYVTSRPRADIAESLGISEEAVRSAINGLKKHGALKSVGSSFSGRTQKYVIMPSDSGGKGLPRITEKKGGRIPPKGVSDSTEKGGRIPPIRGAESDTPTRQLEGATTAPSSEGRSSARHDVDYERMDLERNRSIV